MPFSVVTWNILAQAYVKPDRYPHSPPEALQAAPRRRLLLSQLADLAADIYCLQEVEADAFAAIDAALPDHVGCFSPKIDRPDGSAVFVRDAGWSLVEHETLHFDAIEPGYDHVACLAYLAAGDRRLVVVSTHLRWQGREVSREDHLGRAQLLEVLARRSDQAAAWPVWMIAGDFNTLSDSVVIQAAQERGLRLSCRSQRPWDTVNIGGRRRKFDYLLIDPDALSPRPGTLPRLERDTPMPSAQYPSDHLPVRVEYTWR